MYDIHVRDAGIRACKHRLSERSSVQNGVISSAMDSQWRQLMMMMMMMMMTTNRKDRTTRVRYDR